MPLTLLFITQDDPFYVRIFFEEFLSAYPHKEEIKGVAMGEALGKKNTLALANQMYNFYGAAGFFRVGAKYALNKILRHIPASMAGNGGYSIGQLFKRYKIPVTHEADMRSSSFLDAVEKLNVDVIVSVAAPVIFREPLIRLAKKGCINIHNGKLPKYRGMLPNFWQMYYNEKTAGITVHEINPKIDDGRIILQRDVDILPSDTLDSLIKRTKRIGARVMIEALDAIRSDCVQYKENNAVEGSYFSFPTREDIREFKSRGKRLL
ncbi:Fmt: predicted methionyl-tRNA formyltranserase [Candidatus Sulfobium mesophilum]|uniref:Fmt: predicted methionyl-tRNA formyltranserase n=1 Tax=Candidatus Sulfobium mesophilum TaxID=2016548 RepID=A0A2U3QDM0_9BACT|nr:Fmt: predicted methionyl-tRNA formyltranserase [Candidatus Sulfobium mesophilum]